MYINICVFGQHFFINSYFIEQFDMFCLHIFVYVLSSCRIDFMVSAGID